MNVIYGMTLNSPMTREDWAKITDANMEHTQSVTFQTEGGKKVEFVKVVRCKDCKHCVSNSYPGYFYCDAWGMDLNANEYPPDMFFCAGGER